MYLDFNVKDKTYKLRLETRNMVALEKAIGGKNPLSIFGSGDEIPSVTTMVTILWASLQRYQHGINIDAAYDIFDEYLEEHTITDFIHVITDIYKASGLMRSDKGTEEEKNV